MGFEVFMEWTFTIKLNSAHKRYLLFMIIKFGDDNTWMFNILIVTNSIDYRIIVLFKENGTSKIPSHYFNSHRDK